MKNPILTKLVLHKISDFPPFIIFFFLFPPNLLIQVMGVFTFYLSKYKTRFTFLHENIMTLKIKAFLLNQKVKTGTNKKINLKKNTY